MIALRIAAVALAAGLTGCGTTKPDLDTPEARLTARNAEAALADPAFSIKADEGGIRPGTVEQVRCSGGEADNPRGDFICTATTDTGVTVVCRGQVTNGRVPSSGCSPARLPE